MLMDILKPCVTQGKQELSKIYCCGNDRVYKIGQTSQRYISQRIQTIRKIDANIKLYAYIEFEGSKALRDYVESILRLYMQGQGYQLQGNDHFVKQGRATTFKKHMLDITTTILNELEIDYVVINK
jgi:hypothetical protein